MAILRTWSSRPVISLAVACCIVLQALIAGLHAGHFVDQQLIASDSSICHGGNDTPSFPRSDFADTCCLLGCNVSGYAATVAEPVVLILPLTVSATTRLPIHDITLLRSHLDDRAHNRPRSPPST